MLPPMHVALNVLVVLIVNALPFWGVFGWNLDPAQLVLLFWFENLAITLLISARILVHRRLTRKRGHWNVQSKTVTKSGTRTTVKENRNGSALVAFFVPSLVFTLAHGIFLVILIKVLLPKGTDVTLFTEQVRLAVLTLLGALVLGFLGDLAGIRERPFAWIRQMSEHAFGRVVGIHLILLFGLFTVVMWGTSKYVLAAILALKLMADLGAVMPQMKTEEAPPKWLRFLSRFNKPGQESFEDYWRREHRQDVANHTRDEEVLTDEQIAALRQ